MKKQKPKQKYILSILTAALLLTAMPGAGASVRAAESRYSAGMEAETALLIDRAGTALREIAAEREIMALVYLADEYPVRTMPSYESDTAVNVFSGQMVNILDVYVDDEFEIWEYVELECDGVSYYGYVPRTYLAVSDSRFLQWEEAYGMNPGSSV